MPDWLPHYGNPQQPAKTTSMRLLLSATEAAKTLTALEDNEWGGEWGWCGSCLSSRADGHRTDCRVAAALALLAPEPEEGER